MINMSSAESFQHYGVIIEDDLLYKKILNFYKVIFDLASIQSILYAIE